MGVKRKSGHQQAHHHQGGAGDGELQAAERHRPEVEVDVLGVEDQRRRGDGRVPPRR